MGFWRAKVCEVIHDLYQYARERPKSRQVCCKAIRIWRISAELALSAGRADILRLWDESGVLVGETSLDVAANTMQYKCLELTGYVEGAT